MKNIIKMSWTIIIAASVCIPSYAGILDSGRAWNSYRTLVGFGRIFPEGAGPGRVLSGLIRMIDWEWDFYLGYCLLYGYSLNQGVEKWMEYYIGQICSPKLLDNEKTRRRLQSIEETISYKKEALIDIKDNKKKKLLQWTAGVGISMTGLLSSAWIMLGQGKLNGSPLNNKQIASVFGFVISGLAWAYTSYKLFNTAWLTKARCDRAIERLNIMRTIVKKHKAQLPE
jgi:hypothetical protein